MDLMQLLKAAGGQDSVTSMAKGLGLDSSSTGNLIGALAPALLGGIKKQAESKGGLDSLKSALGSGDHQRYIDSPDLISADETKADGNKILGHLFGSKEVSRNVAAEAAQSTGIDASLIKKALPMLAGLAMGAMSKKSNAGQSLDSSLPGMLGGLMGGDGDFGLDDVMGLAKKFLK